MTVIDKNIDEIKPYIRNVKRHDKYQIDDVAESISKYGWKQPIVIDKDGVIVAGHGRYWAARKLHLATVPCVIADDLTEQEIREYRIADNKTNESEWDFDILGEELADLDFGDFNFELNVEESEERETQREDHSNEKERTYRATNFDLYDPERAEGKYGIPMLKPCNHVPKKLIGFNYAKTSEEYDAGIHFYVDDYQFERIWNEPIDYLPLLKKFDCCLTPNYSIYLDMPEAIKIWNTFRARLLGQLMQDFGILTIPIVYWSDERSYEYCFDGIPVNSTISVNNITDRNETAKGLWNKGMEELIKRKEPKRILIYGNGGKIDFDFGEIETVYYDNSVTQRMRGGV